MSVYVMVFHIKKRSLRRRFSAVQVRIPEGSFVHSGGCSRQRKDKERELCRCLDQKWTRTAGCFFFEGNATTKSEATMPTVVTKRAFTSTTIFKRQDSTCKLHLYTHLIET